MGTRNLVCVVVDNEFKVAQYSQWDGYPTGQGADICTFLQQEGLDLELFRERLKGVEWIDNDAAHAKWVECGADDSGWVTLDVADKLRERYPELSRETGAGILQLVYEGKATELQNSISFAGDSLFCEWAYVVNLDTETLEIYRGFNKERLDPNERFANIDGLEEQGEYQPIRNYVEIPFRLCTVDNMTLLEKVNRDDEEDEETFSLSQFQQLLTEQAA